MASTGPSADPRWRWRRQGLVLIAVSRLRHSRRKDGELATRAARLLLARRRNVRFRSNGFAILFVVSLSSYVKQKYVECPPLYQALDLISTATNRKVSLDSYLLNAGKCKALVLVLSLVTPHLSIFKSVLMEHMSSNAPASAALSGCYYALKDFCRVIARCVDYINDSQGLNPAKCNIFTILDGASTVKLLFSEINSCLQLFLIKVGELSVLPDCSSDLRVLPLPMHYLEHYLQLQADSDRSKLLSRLKELSIASRSTRRLSGADHVLNLLLLQWTETLKSPGFFHTSFWIREEPGVSDLSQLLIARIQYDNMERPPTKKEDIKQGLWVKNCTIKTVRFIGSGSLGMVHEVECFKEKYAMRTIPIKRIEDASEALIQARLQHPHIVKLIWYTTGCGAKNSISLLVELMHMGLDAYLLNRVKDKKCPLSKRLLLAVDVMLQIAKGMEYLHSKSIMHTDLKPSNILLDRERGREGYLTIKLSDFGLSKLKEGDAQAMTNPANVGTSVWRAPEVLSASADEETARYSYSADVYSFAMTCYQILTGKEPYTDMRPENLKWRIRNPQLRPSLPQEDMHPDLVCLIKQYWDDDPNKRPPFHAIYQMIWHVKR